MRKLNLEISLIAIVVLLLAGCDSMSPIKQSIEAIPMASPKLFLSKDTMSIHPPSSSISDYYFPGGQSTGLTNDWVFKMGNQVLKESFGYSIYFLTDLATTAEIEFLMKDGNQEVSLAKSTFQTSKNQWQSYTGQIANSAGNTQRGSQLILRISMKANRWTIMYGSNSTCWVEVFENTQTVTDNVLNERIKALIWMAENNKNEFDPQEWNFKKFNDQLDYLILTGTDGYWLVGDLITKSGLPYRLDWVNNVLQIKELAIEELPEYVKGTEKIIFNPDN